MNKLTKGLLACAMFCVVAQAQERNEVFSFDDVLLAKTVSQAECAAKPHAVWVETSWQGRGMFGSSSEETAAGCIRYFPSANAAGAETAVFFIHGDVMSFEDRPNQNR